MVTGEYRGVRTGGETDLDAENLCAWINGVLYIMRADSCVLKVGGAGLDRTLDLTGFREVSGLRLRFERDRRERERPELLPSFAARRYAPPAWPTYDDTAVA